MEKLFYLTCDLLLNRPYRSGLALLSHAGICSAPESTEPLAPVWGSVGGPQAARSPSLCGINVSPSQTEDRVSHGFSFNGMAKYKSDPSPALLPLLSTTGSSSSLYSSPYKTMENLMRRWILLLCSLQSRFIWALLMHSWGVSLVCYSSVSQTHFSSNLQGTESSDNLGRSWGRLVADI